MPGAVTIDLGRALTISGIGDVADRDPGIGLFQALCEAKIAAVVVADATGSGRGERVSEVVRTVGVLRRDILHLVLPLKLLVTGGSGSIRPDDALVELVRLVSIVHEVFRIAAGKHRECEEECSGACRPRPHYQPTALAAATHSVVEGGPPRFAAGGPDREPSTLHTSPIVNLRHAQIYEFYQR